MKPVAKIIKASYNFDFALLFLIRLSDSLENI